MLGGKDYGHKQADMSQTHCGRYMTVNEVASYIRSTPGTVRVWVSKKKIPYLKCCQKVLFDRHEIDQWLRWPTMSEKESSNELQPKS